MVEIKYSSLIAKQFLGKTTSDEDKEIKDWINKSKEHLKQYRDYQVIWSKTNIHYDAKNSDQVFEKVLNAVGEKRHIYMENDQPTAKNNRIRHISLAVAAAIALVLVATFTVKYSLINNEQKPLEIVTQQKRVTLRGQKMKIFLPDESIVWLNAESSLNFSERFDGSSRIVELDGEAFFQVKKDVSKPFVVRTKQMDVTVLGTSFNVKSYTGEEVVKVALESGKVLVAFQSNEKVLLSPGEGITYDMKSGSIDKLKIDPLNEYGWKDGIIYFRDANFDEIISKLSRWYGVQFEVENFNETEWAYSGEFKNEYLSTILKSMSFSKEFDYRLDQNKVLINFK